MICLIIDYGRAIQFYISIKSCDKGFSTMDLCIKFATKAPFVTNLTICFVAEQLFIVGLTIKAVAKLVCNILINIDVKS